MGRVCTDIYSYMYPQVARIILTGHVTHQDESNFSPLYQDARLLCTLNRFELYSASNTLPGNRSKRSPFEITWTSAMILLRD